MKIKKYLLILFIFTLYFILSSFSYSHTVSKDLKDKTFRLHIIANSDSSIDQSLKLEIRDNVITYLNSLPINNKKELVKYLNQNKDKINEIVQITIQSNGFNYDSSVEIGSSFYPSKKYGEILLPSGIYDGLKIKIGNASGHNWWCVLFPPMCLVDSKTCEFSQESEALLDSSLGKESFNLISQKSPKYVFKFKIVDFINSL